MIIFIIFDVQFSGLCEAAYQLAAAVHEEKNPKVDADAPTPFSFNMDEMSDDDDDGKRLFVCFIRGQKVPNI